MTNVVDLAKRLKVKPATVRAKLRLVVPDHKRGTKWEIDARKVNKILRELKAS